MGAKASELRRELRDLVKAHVPEGFLGAFTDNPADLETAQQFCRTLAERNLLCLSWPQEFGGGDASVNPCRDACEASHPTAAPAWRAYAGCQATSCASACATN